MNYPNFFDTIEKIKLQDSLSEFLGVFEGGEVEFSYLDIVKSAGHSCPTVAGAYLMCLEGLKELYKDKLPQRGNIKVSFKANASDGVIGVISNVLTQITGATESSGFKGINKNFVRHNLMSFGDAIDADIKLTRLDTDASVEISYNPNSVPAHRIQKELMQKILQNIASQEEKNQFKYLWQERVERIFQKIDEVITLNKGE